jgi:hypothetical protein
LRITGENLDVDSLLAEIDLKPWRVWRKGECRKIGRREGECYSFSGVSFYASDAPLDDVDTQFVAATDYITENREAFEKIKMFPGIGEITLDFGIELRKILINSDYFSLRAVTGSSRILPTLKKGCVV